MTTSSNRAFLTVQQFASELGIAPRSVWRRIRDAELVAHRFKGATRISRADADAYIERCRERAAIVRAVIAKQKKLESRFV